MICFIYNQVSRNIINSRQDPFAYVGIQKRYKPILCHNRGVKQIYMSLQECDKKIPVINMVVTSVHDVMVCESM